MDLLCGLLAEQRKNKKSQQTEIKDPFLTDKICFSMSHPSDYSSGRDTGVTKRDMFFLLRSCELWIFVFFFFVWSMQQTVHSYQKKFRRNLFVTKCVSEATIPTLPTLQHTGDADNAFSIWKECNKEPRMVSLNESGSGFTFRRCFL